MKKFLSIAFTLALLASCLTVFTSAEDALPFELTPPANVALSRLPDEGDSPTTMTFSYSTSDEMIEYLEVLSASEDREAFLKDAGLSDLFVTLQVDWAIDDTDDPVSGWHYNENWGYNENYGTFGYDNDGNQCYSEWDVLDAGVDFRTVNEIWILRGVPDDERWNGNPETHMPGVKDQLNPDQYEYHDDTVWIDWDEHTAYVRARYAVCGLKIGGDRFVPLAYSDWSKTASYGKGVEKFKPLTEDDLPAPVIRDLHMTDETFNDNPVCAFTLTVPEELAKAATDVAAAGGAIFVETYARVKGDAEWTLMGNTDWIIKSGEMECALLHLVNDERPVITADTPIELRCRYCCSQPEAGDIFSDYSEVVTFGTDEIKTGNETAADTADTPEVISPAQPVTTEEKCSICHFCPRPLGLCIFIWIATIVVIAVVVIIIIKSRKKKEQK
ncbi:MAG: hypothetical protein IKN38_04800 [Clostridia bacterium]|nr:hypothetical protein [Clostridia bacterium]